eukprot:gene6229-biopygen8885
MLLLSIPGWPLAGPVWGHLFDAFGEFWCPNPARNGLKHAPQRRVYPPWLAKCPIDGTRGCGKPHFPRKSHFPRKYLSPGTLRPEIIMMRYGHSQEAGIGSFAATARPRLLLSKHVHGKGTEFTEQTVNRDELTAV